MNQEPLVVVATIRAKPGKSGELRTAFIELERHSRTEEGCVKYDLHQSVEDAEMFLFYEIWTGEDALARHASSEFMKASRKITGELIDSAELRKYHLAS
jgi:quinol monooxygenase YgiN